MRTNEFTFKKTRRVKTVAVHPAISVDLTVEEAWVLRNILQDAEVERWPCGDEFTSELHRRLDAFVNKHQSETLKRSVKDGDILYFVRADGFKCQSFRVIDPTWDYRCARGAGRYYFADTDEPVAQ